MANFSFTVDTREMAPTLHEVRLQRREAQELFHRIIRNVTIFLAHSRVHADLSAFNVLWWEEGATIIDLPQAVDPRSNPNAADLLARDLKNVCDHFARMGVRRDPESLSRGLWMAFVFAEL